MHIPVMLNEVLSILNPQADFTYVDCTLGLGGHSEALLRKTNGEICLYGIDRDLNSIQLAEKRLSFYPKFRTIHGRFSNITELIDKNKLEKPIDGILLDFGISSLQLNNKEYGLSFSEELFEQPLDMRLDPWCQFSASEILNKWTERSISDMFWDLADYKPARKLARLILNNRPILTIGQFVNLCKQAEMTSNTNKRAKINCATLPFMALRMTVNNELAEIEKGLQNILNWVEPNCKIVVISFHSGEDRLVKNIFKLAIKNKTDFESFEILTDKPLTPTKAEIKQNPRCRSAKLRAIIRK